MSNSNFTVKSGQKITFNVGKNVRKAEVCGNHCHTEKTEWILSHSKWNSVWWTEVFFWNTGMKAVYKGFTSILMVQNADAESHSSKRCHWRKTLFTSPDKFIPQLKVSQKKGGYLIWLFRLYQNCNLFN